MNKLSHLEIIEITERIYKFSQFSSEEYKKSRQELYNLCFKLPSAGMKDEESVQKVIDLHRELVKVQNQRAASIEKDVMSSLVSMCILIDRDNSENDLEEMEILEEKYEGNERIALRLNSMLMNYAKEIITSEVTAKEAKAKRYQNKIAQALQLLADLNYYYEIKGIKEIFKSKMQDENKKIQYCALSGLENYYGTENAEELTEKEEKLLEKIIETTNDRSIVFMCCQILINDGVFDEFDAMSRMDKWKDKNWR